MEKLEIEYLKPGDYYYKPEHKYGYERVVCPICKGTNSIQHTIPNFNNGEPFTGECPCCTEGEKYVTHYSYYVTVKVKITKVHVVVCETGEVEILYRSKDSSYIPKHGWLFESSEECEVRVKELNETTDGIVYKKD